MADSVASPEVSAPASADAAAAPAPETAPAAPDAAAEAAAAREVEVASRTAELQKAMTDAGLMHRNMPSGMRYVGKDRGAPAVAAEPEAAPADKPADAKPPEPPKVEPPKPKPGETPQEQQRRLSDGFAKMARQQKAVEALEANAKKTAANAKAAQDALKAEREAWAAAQAQHTADLKALDGDEVALLDTYAKRRGLTRQAAFDRMTRAMLDGGQVTSDTVAEQFDKKVSAVKDELLKEKEALAAEVKALKEERERTAAAEAAKRSEEAEKTQFVTWVKEGKDGDAAVRDKYPLLAGEDPAEVGGVAYKLSVDFINTQHAQNALRVQRGEQPQPINIPTFEMVADHLEKQLRYAKYQEEQTKPPVPAPPAAPADAAKPAATPPKATGAKATSPAPKPEPTASAPAEPKVLSRNTLTHHDAAARTGATRRPRTDAQRLSEAVEMWK